MDAKDKNWNLVTLVVGAVIGSAFTSIDELFRIFFNDKFSFLNESFVILFAFIASALILFGILWWFTRNKIVKDKVAS